MTQPGDPPTSSGSGRSIYERLGLTPAPVAPRPKPRPIPVVPPPSGDRKILRYLLGIPLLFAGLALLWINLPAPGGGRGQSFASSPSDDERRMDSQDERIKQLDLRIEMLEMKVRALQQLNGYPEEHGAASGLRPPVRTKLPNPIERPIDN
jgi:hypothetical protein